MSEGVFERHPIEDIEPDHDSSWTDINEVRKRAFLEASRRQLYVIEQAVDCILLADNPRIASWQIAFALGLSCCQGRTMTAVAEKLMVTRAAISKGAHAFCAKVGVPPSEYMKSEEASDAYRGRRINELRSTPCQSLN